MGNFLFIHLAHGRHYGKFYYTHFIQTTSAYKTLNLKYLRKGRTDQTRKMDHPAQPHLPHGRKLNFAPGPSALPFEVGIFIYI